MCARSRLRGRAKDDRAREGRDAQGARRARRSRCGEKRMQIANLFRILDRLGWVEVPLTAPDLAHHSSGYPFGRGGRRCVIPAGCFRSAALKSTPLTPSSHHGVLSASMRLHHHRSVVWMSTVARRDARGRTRDFGLALPRADNKTSEQENPRHAKQGHSRSESTLFPRHRPQRRTRRAAGACVQAVGSVRLSCSVALSC